MKKGKKLSIKYKTERRQMRKIWLKSSKKNVDGEEVSFDAFRRHVKDKMITSNLTATQAAKKIANTEEFVTAAERSRTNLISSIRKTFKQEFKQMSEINRRLGRDSKGRFKSMAYNMEWNEVYGAYVLGGRYLIDVTDSPKQINIIDLNWESL